MEDAQNNLLRNGGKPDGRRPRDEEDELAPPDGGSRAWLVMVGSFFCNGIIFGVINSFSVLYTEFHGNLERRNVSDASSKAGERPRARR